jgi:hypothetical protein
MKLALVVFVVLFILKLFGVLTCCWWFVTFPLWLPFASVIALIVSGVILICYGCKLELK